jgi:probable FeS assembly SUF system protein SufT
LSTDPAATTPAEAGQRSATSRHKAVTFEREVSAVIIPDGFHVRIPEGTEGVIMQVLGGHYTVRVDTGYLVRVEGVDADAIGEEVDPALHLEDDGEVDEERVLDILSTCYDPEIPVNIVELGLIYGVDVEDLDEGLRVVIRMTLTAPGCGMGQVLQDDIQRKLGRLPGVVDVVVDLVFDPPWTMERMSEAARLELGMF